MLRHLCTHEVMVGVDVTYVVTDEVAVATAGVIVMVDLRITSGSGCIVSTGPYLGVSIHRHTDLAAELARENRLFKFVNLDKSVLIVVAFVGVDVTVDFTNVIAGMSRLSIAKIPRLLIFCLFGKEINVPIAIVSLNFTQPIWTGRSNIWLTGCNICFGFHLRISRLGC